jgi:hypothetical protein
MVDGQLKRSVRFQRQRQHDGLADVGQPELGEARSTYHALCWSLTAISSPYDDLSPHSGPVAECRKQAYISGSPSRARLAYSKEETWCPDETRCLPASAWPA